MPNDMPMRSSGASMTTAAYAEALERALARVIEDSERRALAVEARCDAAVAAMQARAAEADTRMAAAEAVVAGRLAAAEAEVAARVTARLAEFDRADPAEVAETIRGMIRAAVAEAIPAPVDIAPLTERLAVVEAREMPAPFDPSALVAAISAKADKADLPDVDAAIAKAVGGIAIPEPIDVAALLAEVKAAAPAPFDPSEIEAKVAALGAAVSAIPAPQEPPTLPDVPSLVAEAVQAAVEALPKAQDGKDADPADLEALRAEIATVKAAIPVLPDPPDLSGFALKSEIPAIPEPKDFAPEIEAVARSVNNALERMAQHPGVFPVVRMWSDEVHYAGSVVSHAGATWQALRDTGREPGGGDWACIAAAGAKGDPGVSMTARGTYDPEADYAALDVVAHDGSSWVAKRSAPGSCPGEGWQLIASRGGRGKPGDAVKGDRGDPGPAVRQATVDAEGVVRLLNADGSLVELDLYPLLSRLK